VKPTNCEVRIERQSSLRGGPRLIQIAKPRQGGSDALSIVQNGFSGGMPLKIR
jgi:hypothetical protein